jgi:hypothetical protein
MVRLLTCWVASLWMCLRARRVALARAAQAAEEEERLEHRTVSAQQTPRRM